MVSYLECGPLPVASLREALLGLSFPWYISMTSLFAIPRMYANDTSISSAASNLTEAALMANCL